MNLQNILIDATELEIKQIALGYKGDVLKLVLDLQNILNSPQTEIQEKGLHLLLELIKLGVKSESHYVLAYLSQRLQYSVGLSYITSAMLIMLQTNEFDAKQITLSLFALNVQKQVQSVRNDVFQMIFLIVSKYPVDEEFIKGFIMCMDGEKDPRNLILCFDTFIKLCSVCEITETAQELVDVVFCYFPISFTPPIVFNIRPKDLKDKLTQCFAASNKFAPFIIPMLLSKLSSTNRIKKETLVVLRCLIQRFKDLNSRTIMHQLKQEVFQSMDQEHETLALNAIYDLVRFHEFGLHQILQELMSHLCNPATKLCRGSMLILEVFVRGSLRLADRVLDSVVPVLCSWIETDEAHVKVLQVLLSAAKQHLSIPSLFKHNPQMLNCLLKHKSILLIELLNLRLCTSEQEDLVLSHVFEFPDSVLSPVILQIKEFINENHLMLLTKKKYFETLESLSIFFFEHVFELFPKQETKALIRMIQKQKQIPKEILKKHLNNLEVASEMVAKCNEDVMDLFLPLGFEYIQSAIINMKSKFLKNEEFYMNLALENNSEILVACILNKAKDPTKFEINLNCLNTKALIFRGHELGFEMLSTLISTNKLQKECFLETKGFELKPLMKQRIFDYCFPNLNFEQMSWLMEFCPKSLHQKKLCPLILSALKSNLSLDLKYKYLCLLQTQDLTNVMELMPTLLLLLSFDIKFRLKSLQLIAKVALIQDSNLFKIKKLVIRGLSGCLDDKKRIVRREAVYASNLWYIK